MNEKTIVAISSASGKGYRGVIRVSGEQTFQIVNKYLDVEIVPQKHQWLECNFYIEKWKTTAFVLLYIMKAPFSYTSEDTIEIHTYSSPIFMNTIVDQLLRGGCSPALPGEFTRRAFVSGKIDLAQAEAVATMIAAKTEEERKVAVMGITGKLSQRIHAIQDSCTYVVALMEAHIDFSDEEIDPLAPSYILEYLQPIIKNLQNFSRTSEEIPVDAINVCICGTTNAGKSTLLNLLCENQVSLVSDISGTTLDYVEEKIVLENNIFHLMDTPGIELYAEGVQKSAQEKGQKIIEYSDVILFVIDSSIEYQSLYGNIAKYFCSIPVAIIYNKIDLPFLVSKQDIINNIRVDTLIESSFKNQQGIPEIKRWLVDKAEKIQTNKDEILLNTRQYYAIQKAIEVIQESIEGVENKMSYEFIVGDMRLALDYLGEVVGQVTTEDILDKVFSNFCIGK